MEGTGGLGAWSIGVSEPMFYFLLIGFVISRFGLRSHRSEFGIPASHHRTGATRPNFR